MSYESKEPPGRYYRPAHDKGLTDAISIRQSDDRQAVLSKLKQIDNGVKSMAGLKLVEFQETDKLVIKLAARHYFTSVISITITVQLVQKFRS